MPRRVFLDPMKEADVGVLATVGSKDCSVRERGRLLPTVGAKGSNCIIGANGSNCMFPCSA